MPRSDPRDRRPGLPFARWVWDPALGLEQGYRHNRGGGKEQGTMDYKGFFVREEKKKGCF